MACKQFSKEDVLYMAHHVFLPPKLPTKSDAEPTQDGELADAALRSLRLFLSTTTQSAVQTAITMMENMASVHEAGASYTVREDSLRNALQQLSKSREGTSISLHVVAQNAGVIFTKTAGHVNCEVFELSPPNEDVMSVNGRLRRSFPASGVALPLDAFDDGLCATLAATLSKLSVQSVPGTTPRARKATQMHDEERDTTDPKIVTTFFGHVSVSAGRTCAHQGNLEEHPRGCGVPKQLATLEAIANLAVDSCGLAAESFSGPDGAEPCLDLLYSMYAKVHRRHCKHVGDAGVRKYAQKAMRTTIDALQKRWQCIQEQDAGHVDLTALAGADWKGDARVAIPELDEFVRACSERTSVPDAVDFNPKTIMTQYSSNELPDLQRSDEDSEAFDLLSFESWVACHLDTWLAEHMSDERVCESLAVAIRDYHAKMKRLYGRNPECMSTMMLTLLELWVACDKAAVYHCPLLAEYNPGVPTRLLEALLLPLKIDMKRLETVETYLYHRSRRATRASTGVFTAFGTPDCFAVRWFQKSKKHRDLMASIESSASALRNAKLTELHACKDRYQSLMNMHSNTSHNNTTVYVRTTQTMEAQHVEEYCQKCKYLRDAGSIQIEIYEWPLPRDELEAQSTVFELVVPPPFGHWRDVTLFLRLDVMQGSYSTETTPQTQYLLQDYRGLSIYFVSFSTTQRSHLLSETKPHGVTHRRNRNVTNATSEYDVCLVNGLQYAYHDSRTGLFVDAVCFSGRMEAMCMYAMPPASQSLQKFLYRPAEYPSGPSSNTAIASQSACPSHFTLQEYTALCTLPLGNRIQWQNILLQLHAPAVNFKKVETLLTVLQCLLQAGPRGDVLGCRESHAVIEDDQFASGLLRGLDIQLQHIKSNWQASHAINTLICLACRLSTLTTDLQTSARCLLFLDSCRAVALDWLGF
ncbi:hypothetical protein NLG97_g3045 [Lecanicillium saksenae]|uniref:Uncharacterized protein n=1 Tax=Lecanicillium saksenae TaxID=468837 RepID=A0ACC1R0G3_9HYPO|nr:hypothetical protein NLG97_g3045 [Lecanicillium saksenae]